MEHLLPSGDRVPIRVPNYQPRPDEDGNIATVDDCARLFGAAVKQPNHREAGEDETTALWIEQCHKGRVYNLCHVLLDQFYFGLIYQILGPDTIIADFTVRDADGSVFLTTEKLEEYLLLWKARVDQLDDDQLPELSDRLYSMLYQSMLVLRSLARFLFWSYENVPVKQAYPDDKEPLGNTQFACALLHQSFVRARVKIFGMDDAANYELYFHSPWLLKRMEREGWCLHTIAVLNTWSIHRIAYAYHLATVRTDAADHGRCTPVACLANDIPDAEEHNHGNVQRGVGLRHVNHDCDCWIIDAPLADIAIILEDGNIPVLKIGTDDGYKLTLHARKATPATEGGRYIALSHVWVDGLGSPYSNTITQCQLTRVADRLGKLEATESCGELCIWIDTLCVPVSSQHSHLRQLAIVNMHQVYRDAYAVMVMDEDLLRMQPRPSLQELGMRLSLSAWSTRLWTYQEGALNDRLLVMTFDGFLDVDEYPKQWKHNKTPRSKLQHLLEEFAVREINAIRGPYSLSANSSQLPQVPVPRRNNREGFDWTAQMQLNAIVDRTSSRADDEVIVVATYLDLELSAIFSRSGDEKMVALLQAMPSIPNGVFYAEGARIKRRGFRWAPRSFTRAKGGNAYIGLGGLPTQSSLDQLPRQLSKPSTEVSKLDGLFRGLWAFAAAIKLDKVLNFESESERDGPFMVFQLWGSIHRFDLAINVPDHQHEEEKEILRASMQQMSKARKQVVILLGPSTRTTDQRSRAALVQIVGEVDDPDYGNALKVKYILPGALEQAYTIGAQVLEAIEEAIEADGQSSGDLMAEWVEARHWLVD